MLTKREVVQLVLSRRQPPYVPWSFSFTLEAKEKLDARVKELGLSYPPNFGDHFLSVGGVKDRFDALPNARFRDYFGVIWDRSEDKDIGVVSNPLLPEPDLTLYRFPDPTAKLEFPAEAAARASRGDACPIFNISFSLFERAWTLRGMENLLMDFYENPDFVRALLRAIADFNIAQIEEALKHGPDAVMFGDDWGQQHGLIMGPALWREFIFPELKRMYGVVKQAGKKVIIHSCGDVDELFDDLIGIGLDCFNPFQPEVMDTFALFKRYRGKLAFWGGLSTQQVLPYGSPEEVRRASLKLLKAGAAGGYIFAPAHSVEGDVPADNMLAFIDAAFEQMASL